MSDTRKRTTPQDRLEITLSYEMDGKTISQIARESGYSRNTVSRILGRRAYPASKYAKNGPEANPCGTNAAYWRHKRAGQRPCLECYAAHAAEVQEAKRRSKNRKKRSG